MKQRTPPPPPPTPDNTVPFPGTILPFPGARQEPPPKAEKVDLPDFLTKEFYLQLCTGNAAAAELCETLLRDFHLTDDICDGDKALTDEALVFIRLGIMQTFSLNPFWLEHCRSISPLLIQASAAWLDANRFERGVLATRADPAEAIQYRRGADVLKSQYGEVLWHIAFLCGGWNHMRELQREYRVFNFDCKD